MVGVNVIRGTVPEWAVLRRFGDRIGIGYGDGYGSGTGYGTGYGSGDGYGSGTGIGSGDGSGTGYGTGYSFGDGSGYGDGSGDGSGTGYGDGDYWLATIPYHIAGWSDVQRARLAELQAAGATIAFWRSNAEGAARNGGCSNPVQDGAVQIVEGPLSLCHGGTLHATKNPTQWKGKRLWIVALSGEVVSDGEKYGALQREILGEVKQMGTPAGG